LKSIDLLTAPSCHWHSDQVASGIPSYSAPRGLSYSAIGGSVAAPSCQSLHQVAHLLTAPSCLQNGSTRGGHLNLLPPPMGGGLVVKSVSLEGFLVQRSSYFAVKELSVLILNI